MGVYPFFLLSIGNIPVSNKYLFSRADSKSKKISPLFYSASRRYPKIVLFWGSVYPEFFIRIFSISSLQQFAYPFL